MKIKKEISGKYKGALLQGLEETLFSARDMQKAYEEIKPPRKVTTCIDMKTVNRVYENWDGTKLFALDTDGKVWALEY